MKWTPKREMEEERGENVHESKEIENSEKSLELVIT